MYTRPAGGKRGGGVMTPEQIVELVSTLKDKENSCEAEIAELNTKIEYWKGKAQGYFEARQVLLNMLEESEDNNG
jgi:hypothetical protein